MLHTRTRTRATVAAASALALALTASACATDDAADAADTTGTAAVEGTDTSDSAALVQFDEAWAKATDTEMSGVFGTLRNASGEEIHLTGVSGEIDGAHELHETVPGGGSMMMQEKEDGFVIPADGELTFEPGGDHIMLMGLTDPITTGQQIELTLEFGDGSEQDVTISARDFEGGEENYVGDDHGSAGHGSAEHDD